jgi:hypothetical protein
MEIQIKINIEQSVIDEHNLDCKNINEEYNQIESEQDLFDKVEQAIQGYTLILDETESNISVQPIQPLKGGNAENKI